MVPGVVPGPELKVHGPYMKSATLAGPPVGGVASAGTRTRRAVSGLMSFARRQPGGTSRGPGARPRSVVAKPFDRPCAMGRRGPPDRGLLADRSRPGCNPGRAKTRRADHPEPSFQLAYRRPGWRPRPARMRTLGVTAFDTTATPARPSGGAARRVAGTHAGAERPPPAPLGPVPALSPRVKHAIAVDVAPQAVPVRERHRPAACVGLLHLGRQARHRETVEGDQRTPMGVLTSSPAKLR